MAASSLLCISLCLLILCRGSLAQVTYGGTGKSPWHASRRFTGPTGCRFDRFQALNPSQRMRFEAGMTEYYEWDNEMMQCAGVSASRHILEPRGLLLPHYNNAPSLMYIVQGRGFMGTAFPGCPETFQSFQQESEEQEQFPVGSESWRQQRTRDEHQRVHRFKQGDTIALPAGVTYWCYNDGDVAMVSVQVYDASNTANQLVPWERGLQMLMPTRSQEMQQQEFEESTVGWQQYGEGMWGPYNNTNGLDEMFCTMKIRSNIDRPSQADYFNERGSWVTILSSQMLPILNVVQMSAGRVVLQRNTMITPYWHMNSHSLMYVTSGQGRVQVVNHRGQAVFDGQLHQGQILLIPQTFAVLKRASEREMFHWVSFVTNSNDLGSQIVGKASVLRGIPLQVLMNSYRLSMEQARVLKFGRQDEMIVFGSRHQTRSSE